MNTQPIETVTERISLFISDNYAEPRWVEIDTTGAAPETVNGFERATGTDAAVPIYRSPALTRPRYAMLEELVKISSGIAPAEGAHREQMQALRERAETAEAEIEERAQELSAGAVKRAMARANDAHQRYETANNGGAVSEQAARAGRARSLAAELRIEKIIEEARRWKRRALAAEAEADTLHAAITSAEMRARVAERDRDLIERKLDGTLNVLRQNREILATERAERLDAEARVSDAQAKALSTIEKIANLIPAPESAELPPFEISTYYGTDNTPVVEIDTQLIEGRLRINLNDAPIWDGDPETDERPGANLLETDVREIRGATIIGATVTQDSNGRGFISVEAEIDDPREVEFPSVGDAAFPAPRQSMKATISRQLEEIRDRDARIEELEEDRTEARNELEATRRELASASESLRLSEQHYEKAVALSEQRQTDHENATHLAELHQTAYEEMKRLAEQRQVTIDTLTRQRIEVGQELELKDAMRRKLEEVGATPWQVDAALRIMSSGRMTYADAKIIAPSDPDPLDAGRLVDENGKRQEQIENLSWELNQARLDATAADEMRRKLDKRLADVTRAGAITASIFPSLIRQRDEVIRLAAQEIENDGLTASAFEQARKEIPEFYNEPTSRADESVLDGLRATQNVIRAWKAAPQYELTEQLNIALAKLAEKHGA